MEEQIRIVLVDGSLPFREGLRLVLQPASGVLVVGEADNGETALPLIESLQPDVTMLDCQLPGMSGVQVTARLKQNCVQTNVLACSAHDDADCVRGMLDAGAVGYVLKDESPAKIIEAVRAAARGQNWFSHKIAAKVVQWMRVESELNRLSPREAEVLRLLTQGKDNHQIALELCITERTVRAHLQNIRDKLDVASDRAAIVWATRRG